MACTVNLPRAWVGRFSGLERGAAAGALFPNPRLEGGRYIFRQGGWPPNHLRPDMSDAFTLTRLETRKDALGSSVEGVAVGERFYGYFPVASHLRMRPVRVTGRGFYDGAPHRGELVSA